MSPPRRDRRPAIAIGAVAIGVVVVAILFVVFSAGAGTPTPGTGTGLQTGPPPWAVDSTNLRAHLGADGLQVLTAEGQVQHTHQHLDLFVDGAAVEVPANIGIDFATGILSPIHTHDATGIIHVESPVIREFTLGELFDVWGVRFDAHCVGGTCDGNGRVLSVFRNGQPVAGDPRSLVLEAHEEIVVAIGTAAQLPSPLPSSYAFPTGL